MNHEQEPGEPRVCSPYIPRGSALRPTPFSAPPSFEAFREASRKGAFLDSDRVTPRIHQSRASRLAFLVPAAEKKGRENPRTSAGFLVFFTPRSRTPFRRDEKGRSVICRFKITIAKEKHYLKESQPGEHEEFPFNNGGEIYLNINLAA